MEKIFRGLLAVCLVMMAAVSANADVTLADGKVAGYSVGSGISIGALIHTYEQGPIAAMWEKTSETVTARGDKVIQGYFYASPDDVTWGSQRNAEAFVKIWFDVAGRIDVNFFHTSVPAIDVYSAYSGDDSEQMGTIIMEARHVGHEYARTSEQDPDLPGLVPVDSDQWKFDAKEARVEEYLGRKSIYLKGGFALIKDLEFTDGTIEFDVAFDSEYYTTDGNRGFVGCVFRLQDESNYEKFYIRPHRIQKEDDAMQMVPVYNHWSTWQLYWDGHVSGIQVVHDEWMHIKLLVSGKYCEIYVDDMENPVLTSELKREIKAGEIGLKVDPSTPGYARFSNITVTETTPELKNMPETAAAAPEGTVATWLVSDPFDAATLEGKNCLTEDDRENTEWTELDSDPSTGVTALARLHSIAADPPNKNPGDDTVFVRTTIISEKDQLRKLQFGYSDLIRLYFNGRLLYTENNSFGSRDFRFMGVMRYANELHLPLKEGENEIWMAVTGLFASWGVQARFEDTEGIEITTTGQTDLGASDSDPFCSQ